MNELTQFLLSHGGPVLFAIVFAEQAGLPLPSAPWLLAAGALSAAGKLNPALALAMTALACGVADSMWFYVLSESRGPSPSVAAADMTISLTDPAPALASTAVQTARVDAPSSLVQVNPCGL